MTDLAVASIALLAALGVPLLYLVGAFWVPAGPRDRLFPRAGALATTALGLALVQAAAFAGMALGAPGGPSGAAAAAGVVRLDPVTSVMLTLVAFIAFIIARYSGPYVGGEPGEARYARWLLVTLAAVTTIVVADNLLVMVLAWTGTSLSLHQLLTFYRERPQALIAAHKKFIVSRLADVALLAAALIVALEVGGLGLGAIDAYATGAVAAGSGLPLDLHIAALLLVVGACLRTAQLPFHGWLTQVMEAPTPVSALLHAGVVNLGGFLMIRLAPLMEASPVAQTMLVIIGTGTAVLAALIMTTRVSIKVALAWSTCAQMGFMMLQCGLGAYELALLHLVAHSLYKAHAFLSSGSTVERWRVHALAAHAPAQRSLGHWVVAGVAGLLGVAAVATILGVRPAAEPALIALAFVLSLAVTPLVVRGAGTGARGAATSAVLGVAVATLYFGWHGLFTGLVPAAPEVTAAAIAPRIGLVVVGFAALFGIQAAMSARPDGALARALYPRLYAGLFLDELFTRLTFRLWPAKAVRPESTPAVETVEVV